MVKLLAKKPVTMRGGEPARKRRIDAPRRDRQFSPMDLPTERDFAPFRHPRRDRYLRRARVSAAAVAALANAIVFLLAVVAIGSGVTMTLAAWLMVTVGTLVIASRLSFLTELALHVVDSVEGLDFAPRLGELLRAATVGILLPWGASIAGMAFLGNDTITLAALGAVLLLEILFRFGGHSRIHTERLPTPVLRSLFTEPADGNARAFAKATFADPRAAEYAALTVSGAAIRETAPGALETLAKALADLCGSMAAHPEVARIERAARIVEADRSRLTDPLGAAEAEAQAYRATEPGHPRRLSLALFVATAAMELDQPEAAITALRRLHTRDADSIPARVFVNWLLEQAARRIGDEALAVRCQQAQATFNLRREAQRIAVDSLKDSPAGDPYARWMQKAKDALGK